MGVLKIEYITELYRFFLRNLVSQKYFKDYSNAVVLGDGIINSTYVVIAEVGEDGEMLNDNYIDCRKY